MDSSSETSVAIPETTSVVVSSPLSPPKITLHKIPTGKWNFFFHEREHERSGPAKAESGKFASWKEDSYKLIQTSETIEGLAVVLREMGVKRCFSGLVRIMLDPYSPLWEDSKNIQGGSYSLSIPNDIAFDVFKLYLAAAALGCSVKDPSNKIVGVSFSSKRGTCVIKIWNLDANKFNKPSGLEILHPSVVLEGIRYTANVDQRS